MVKAYLERSRKDQMALMAHLLRRAGSGATREELEDYLARGYEATAEELLHPGAPTGRVGQRREAAVGAYDGQAGRPRMYLHRG